MSDLIVKETNVWGQFYKAKGMTRTRLTYKSTILHGYFKSLIEEYKIYALVPRDHKGSPKETQTFVVIYSYDLSQEKELLKTINTIHLGYHKEECVFNEKPGYKIYIMDIEVTLDKIKNLV